jgi:hypothetical protein
MDKKRYQRVEGRLHGSLRIYSVKVFRRWGVWCREFDVDMKFGGSEGGDGAGW